MAAKTWSRTTGDANWSTAANWNGGTVPAAGDTVTFNGTSVLDCTVNNVGTFNGSITVDALYSGTVTQNVNVTAGAAAAFSIAGGTWVQAAAFTCTTMEITGGTWTGGSQAMNLAGTLTFSGGTFTMTSGTCTISTGSFNQSNTPTFTANGGTLSFTGSGTQTFTAPNCLFTLVTVLKSGGTFNHTAGTTLPLGNNPTITCGGSASHNVNLNGTVTATGTLTFSGGNLTVDPGATLPASWAINFTTGTGTPVITAAGDRFGTCSINGTGGLVIAAGTEIDLGNNPTITLGSIGLTVEGALTWTGTATTIRQVTFGAAGGVTGSCALTLTDTNFTATATSSLSGLAVTMNFATGTGRTFAGGGCTIESFTRTGSGSATITITGANNLGCFTDNLGLVAHTIIFPNVTTTFTVTPSIMGSAGKLVTLTRTGGAGVWTVTKTAPGDVNLFNYVNISNSTADAFPNWYAGPNSVDGGGNTNWIFNTAPAPKYRRRAFMLG